MIIGGGLELATALGDKLRRRHKTAVILIEKSQTHFWKTHLHGIAAGSMDLGSYELNHLAQPYWHGYRYRYGEVVDIDRDKRLVTTAPYVDEHGEQVIATRVFQYDTLVICIGSLSNDFGTPGVKENAIALETPTQAARFHRHMVNACTQPDARRPDQLSVATIGTGATGVDMAAELHKTTRTLVS